MLLNGLNGLNGKNLNGKCFQSISFHSKNAHSICSIVKIKHKIPFYILTLSIVKHSLVQSNEDPNLPGNCSPSVICYLICPYLTYQWRQTDIYATCKNWYMKKFPVGLLILPLPHLFQEFFPSQVMFNSICLGYAWDLSQLHSLLYKNWWVFDNTNKVMFKLCSNDARTFSIGGFRYFINPLNESSAKKKTFWFLCWITGFKKSNFFLN